jgi:hypothetical protein
MAAEGRKHYDACASLDEIKDWWKQGWQKS